SLSDKDKNTVRALWAKISKSADVIGAEALARMLTVYPQTKTYFTHWTDLSPSSTSVKNHGKNIMVGVSLAVSKMDDLTAGLLELSEKHAFQLRVDPANFKLLSHCLLVVISIMFPKEFGPEVHVSVDKFFANLALALSERYR
uniref:Hemoglobin subunit alpha n=1 Tax=Chelidonichthys kumu TaxID=334942 RepID=HBA_CHEKU|nr:RecName: Full=Hemoglobin subunit alpha; AltName: Full=Alpha-globin; AltName: Full=Hemoglobin alpha chain [Chelidonichthys kumu]